MSKRKSKQTTVNSNKQATKQHKTSQPQKQIPESLYHAHSVALGVNYYWLSIEIFFFSILYSFIGYMSLKNNPNYISSLYSPFSLSSFMYQCICIRP